MRVAIMQPTYLPWLGYFDLMDQVDTFVLLDVVQFSYQSWQHRNRIPINGEMRWLTVPVLHAGRFGQQIRDVEVAPSPKFPAAHVNLLTESFRRSPQGGDAVEEATLILDQGYRSGRLVDITIPAIRWLAVRLGVTVNIVLASEIGVVEGWRSELLVRILNKLGSNEYVTPPGAVDYLRDDRRHFLDANIAIFVHDYEHPVYPQGATQFVPYASAVDALAWTGDAASDVLRSGRRPASLMPP